MGPQLLYDIIWYIAGYKGSRLGVHAKAFVWSSPGMVRRGGLIGGRVLSIRSCWRRQSAEKRSKRTRRFHAGGKRHQKIISSSTADSPKLNIHNTLAPINPVVQARPHQASQTRVLHSRRCVLNNIANTAGAFRSTNSMAPWSYNSCTMQYLK